MQKENNHTKLEEIFKKYIDSRIGSLENRQRFNAQEFRSLLVMPKDIKTYPCVSSNVVAYGYHQESKVLKVIYGMNKDEYRYLNISPRVYGLLENAPSKGKFIHQQIKFRHSVVKITNTFFGKINASSL